MLMTLVCINASHSQTWQTLWRVACMGRRVTWHRHRSCSTMLPSRMKHLRLGSRAALRHRINGVSNLGVTVSTSKVRRQLCHLSSKLESSRVLSRCRLCRNSKRSGTSSRRSKRRWTTSRHLVLWSPTSKSLIARWADSHSWIKTWGNSNSSSHKTKARSNKKTHRWSHATLTIKTSIRRSRVVSSVRCLSQAWSSPWQRQMDRQRQRRICLHRRSFWLRKWLAVTKRSSLRISLMDSRISRQVLAHLARLRVSQSVDKTREGWLQSWDRRKHHRSTSTRQVKWVSNNQATLIITRIRRLANTQWTLWSIPAFYMRTSSSFRKGIFSRRAGSMATITVCHSCSPSNLMVRILLRLKAVLSVITIDMSQ